MKCLKIIFIVIVSSITVTSVMAQGNEWTLEKDKG